MSFGFKPLFFFLGVILFKIFFYLFMVLACFKYMLCLFKEANLTHHDLIFNSKKINLTLSFNKRNEMKHLKNIQEYKGETICFI